MPVVLGEKCFISLKAIVPPGSIVPPGYTLGPLQTFKPQEVKLNDNGDAVPEFQDGLPNNSSSSEINYRIYSKSSLSPPQWMVALFGLPILLIVAIFKRLPWFFLINYMIQMSDDGQVN
jgi:hypothetical protein